MARPSIPAMHLRKNPNDSTRYFNNISTVVIWAPSIISLKWGIHIAPSTGDIHDQGFSDTRLVPIGQLAEPSG
jgi:hypothetical protein